MLLEHKVAVIYGAGGSIGGTVARAFAREGARVFLAGIEQASMLKRAATLADDGNVAAFVASDLDRTITASDINICRGAFVD